MADFELLAPGGHQKLVDEVIDRLDLKADIDGYYAQLTAGAADNLTGRGDATAAEFLYRTAGGTADIETGQAVAKSVKGNTLGWNQLAPSIESASWRAAQYTTASRDGGKITATVTTAGYGFRVGIVNASNTVKGVRGHKYLVSYYVLCDKAANFGCDALNSGGKVLSACTAGVRSCIAGIFDYPTSEEFVPNVNIYLCSMTSMSVGDTFTIDSPQLFDLTKMFGAGNEPSTVAEFEALFPEPYYEYDAGSLLSVNMEGIETVGFNQWDEQWESGLFVNETGAKYANSSYIRSKTPIPCFPSTTYSATKPTAPGFHTYFYDAGMNFIKHEGAIGLNASQVQFITPANARYMNFCIGGSSAVTTYNHDICINLSWSGRRNGEYESFWSAQREIAAATYFPDGMRSAGTVRDELTSTEAIVRVGVVDLGTLTWTYSNDFFRTSDLNSVILRPASNYTAADAKCSKYEVASWNSELDKSVMVGKDAGNPLLVKDTDYTDAAAFKTAMSGVMLYYALATPTVTPIDPPLNLSYRVDDFGTERVMVPEDERSAPPVLDIAYALNVVDFVRRAPSEYISHASFAQYLLARDAHDGTTTTMTWDDTDNRYEFAITDTVTEG